MYTGCRRRRRAVPGVGGEGCIYRSRGREEKAEGYARVGKRSKGVYRGRRRRMYILKPGRRRSQGICLFKFKTEPIKNIPRQSITLPSFKFNCPSSFSF